MKIPRKWVASNANHRHYCATQL